jgi:3-oxoacid CoA-transferase subunit B
VDLIITDLCVMECDKRRGGGLTLTELAPGVTLDAVRALSGAPFRIGDEVSRIALDSSRGRNL